MPKRLIVTALRNIAVLVLVAMPLFFLLTWLQALVTRTLDADALANAAETGAVYFLANAVAIVIGGVIHQGFWLSMPRGWSLLTRRAAALVAALVIIPVAVLVAWGGSASNLLPFAVPMVLALLAYVILSRDAPQA
jgi:hypothetical protein